MNANTVTKGEEGRNGRLTGKHILLAVLGALLVTALGVLRAPLDLTEISVTGWILLLIFPFVSAFSFYALIRRPEYSVFRFIKSLYCLLAPAIPVLWYPVLYDLTRPGYYASDFMGSFFPKWALLWVIGTAALYAFLRLMEYAGSKILVREDSSSTHLLDLAVMYTPQKTISATPREGRKKWFTVVILMLLIAPAVFLFAVTLFLFNVYSNMEFEGILFTVRFAKGGLAIEDVIAGVEYTMIFVLIAGYIFLQLYKCFRNDRLVVADTNKDGQYTLVMTRKKRALHIVMSILLVLGCAAFFTIQTNFLHYVNMKTGRSTIYETYYVKPDESVISFPEQKRNLIFIYLESMESTYASGEAGGSQEANYIPELTELTKEGDTVHFSNTELLGGASVFVPSITFTQGSTVAQTAGISLNTQIIPQNGVVEYPSTVRLEDILHENGYNQYYIEGSKGEFSMYDEYVGRYDDSKLYDRIALTEQGYSSEDGDYIWKWGIEDRKLFDITKEIVTEASKEDKPFFVTMYTMDTHSYECGHRCVLCDDGIDHDYLATVNCTSRQTLDFVRWVQQQPFYENTTVILVGDHLGNKKTAMVDIDDDYVRTTYNCIINPAKEPVNTKNRKFSSLDMFPTTLSAIGVDIKGDRLGLGTDLFSPTETLCEKLGEAEYRKQLEQSSDYYDRVFTGK